MIYYRDTKDIRLPESVVTLGKYDGLHIGHQTLLAAMREKTGPGLPGVLFTFDPKDFRSRSLLSEEERREKAERLGVDIFLDWPFDEETRHMDPESFIREILCGRLNMKYLVVGDDFRFGYKRSGDVETLARYACKYGYEVEILRKLTYLGDEVSSTRIRKCLEDGCMEDVTAMLGEPFSFRGRIVHGRHLGTQMGIPTINVRPGAEKLLPPYGVYASVIRIGTEEYQGVSNLGVKPTVADIQEPGLETYLFHAKEDLYGREAEVRLLHQLRPEIRFESLEELKKQIRSDCESAIRYLNQE